MPSDLLQIGSVCRPHGLGGELRVRLHDPLSTALDGLRQIWLSSDAATSGQLPAQAWKIRTARRVDGGFYLLSLHGLSHRDKAEALRDHLLLVDRLDLPRLAEDEYYVADLVGCRVILPDGQQVGVAREVQDLAGNQLLVVERPPRADALVPLVASMVVSVDLTVRSICIDPPEGLLDLDIA
jgi:16S rRNA processing protein RimM